MKYKKKYWRKVYPNGWYICSCCHQPKRGKFIDLDGVCQECNYKLRPTPPPNDAPAPTKSTKAKMTALEIDEYLENK